MKYLCATLAVAVAILGWLYCGATDDLVSTKNNLAAAEAVNKANTEATERLERSIGNTESVLAGWEKDRTTLAGIRSATRQAIKEAMRDENFKNWASTAAPDDAWRMFNPEHIDANKRDSAISPASTTARLP